MKRLTREELRVGALMYPPVEDPRPTSREECRGDVRPCPWVACKHHLYLDVNPETGSIKINFPDLEPWELRNTCALDVAERGGITLEEVGEIMNLTRERIRQVEVRGLLKLKMASPSPEELGRDLLRKPPIDN
ncbi:MAG: DNA-binding protein [Deltaproteobacteria bacterium]|nr:DNA-binding protein [Deltaproteobacteria bacterium]